MKLPLPTYGRFASYYSIIEAITVFVTKIDAAIKALTEDSNMRFYSKNHLIQLIMSKAGMFMCEESFRDVETYLADGIGPLLRKFGVTHE